MAYNYNKIHSLNDVDENWVTSFLTNNISTIIREEMKNPAVNKRIVKVFVKLMEEYKKIINDEKKAEDKKTDIGALIMDTDDTKKLTLLATGLSMLNLLDKINNNAKIEEDILKTILDDNFLKDGGRRKYRKKRTKRRRKKGGGNYTEGQIIQEKNAVVDYSIGPYADNGNPKFVIKSIMMRDFDNPLIKYQPLGNKNGRIGRLYSTQLDASWRIVHNEKQKQGSGGKRTRKRRRKKRTKRRR